MKKLIITALFLLLLISSCTRSERPEEPPEMILPDMILTDGRFTLYQENEMPITFTAERASFYSADSLALIENISFVQRDADGNITIEGRAESAELDTDNKRLTLKGNVFLNSIRDEMMITTDGTLFFDTVTEEVETSDSVTVTSSDGEFSSAYFYGNLLLEEYSFADLSEGRIVI